MALGEGTKIEDIMFALDQIKDIKEDTRVIGLVLINFSLDKQSYGEKLLEVKFEDGKTESIELP